MKKLQLSIYALFLWTSGFAQYEPTLSQYWNNYTFINPAFVNIDEKLNVSLSGRNESLSGKFWPGMVLSGTYQSSKINGGIGLNYEHQTASISQLNKYKLRYFYLQTFKNGSYLSGGVSLGVCSVSYDSQIIGEPDLHKNGSVFSSDIGVMYQNSSLKLGVSYVNWNDAKISESFREPSFLNLFASYDLKLSESFHLKPFLKYNTNFVELDLNALLEYKKTFAIGAGFRSKDGYSLTAQLNLWNRFKVGYSLETSISKLQKDHSYGHEIYLGYSILNKD